MKYTKRDVRRRAMLKVEGLRVNKEAERDKGCS